MALYCASNVLAFIVISEHTFLASGLLILMTGRKFSHYAYYRILILQSMFGFFLFSFSTSNFASVYVVRNRYKMLLGGTVIMASDLQR